MKKEKVRYRVWLKPKDEIGFWTWTKAVSSEEAIAHAIYHLYGAISHDSFEEKIAEEFVARSSSLESSRKTKVSRQLFLPGCKPNATFL